MVVFHFNTTDNQYYIYIYIYIYFKYFTVSWNTTSSIKFHAKLTLECRIESTEGGIPKWSGGYLNDILTFNRTSYYKEKYLVESNMQQLLYNLAILDFSEHDVNVLYTCHYGFEQYSKNLTLDNGNFKSTYLFELFLFILLFYNPSTSFKMHREILSIIYRKSKVHKKTVTTLSTIFLLDFGTVPKMWYFFFIFSARVIELWYLTPLVDPTTIRSRQRRPLSYNILLKYT